MLLVQRLWRRYSSSTGIHEEAMEPHAEAFGIAQLRGLGPAQQEGLLDGVLGTFRVTQDAVGDGVAAVAMQVDELGGCVLVAVARPFDQPVRRRALRLAPDESGASTAIDGRSVSKGSRCRQKLPVEVAPAFERRLHLGPRPFVDAEALAARRQRTSAPGPGGSRGRVRRSSHALEAPRWRVRGRRRDRRAPGFRHADGRRGAPVEVPP